MEREGKKPWAALLGCEGTKRKRYLEHAAGDIGLHVLFIDWKAWKDGFWKDWLADHGTGGILKIDPPVWDSAELDELPGLTKEYGNRLEELAQLGESKGIRFLNHPREICRLLDKRACKAKLAGAGILVTEELLPFGALREGMRSGFSEKTLSVKTAAELLAVMEAGRASQVFIKPNWGSGALGVTAFRLQRRTGKMVLYTCAAWEPEGRFLVNTKKLQRVEGEKEIFAFLNQLLKLDCVIERWYAKAEHGGYTYDLRAVIQDGKMDFLLARLSKGPITNLQLNNHPLSAQELHLPAGVLDAVEMLCQEAVSLYPGIRSAGIDILLEKGSFRPRIIEMNGQGDLIYQDIYHENRIYRHQVQMMAIDSEGR